MSVGGRGVGRERKMRCEELGGEEVEEEGDRSEPRCHFPAEERTVEATRAQEPKEEQGNLQEMLGMWNGEV